MKYLITFLISLTLGFGLSFTLPTSNPSTEDQTARLNQSLWKIQGQFNAREYDFQVKAARVWEMEAQGCHNDWGCSNLETAQIYIRDVRDMPQSMPWGKREAFQDTVLQHEVMHFVLSADGVPPDFQDKLIHTLQPALVSPVNLTY
jgi:hypothetical protein